MCAVTKTSRTSKQVKTRSPGAVIEETLTSRELKSLRPSWFHCCNQRKSRRWDMEARQVADPLFFINTVLRPIHTEQKWKQNESG